MASTRSGDDGRAELSAVCEVCGLGAAARVMVQCKYYGPDHQVGRHSFCGPGPSVKGKREDDYTCLACLQYCRSLKDAVDAYRDHRKGQAAKPEEMPALKPLPAPAPRVRHAFEVVTHPTEQQKINKAAAAAAGGADHDGDEAPRKRRKLDSRAADEAVEVPHKLGPRAAAAGSGKRAGAAAAAAGAGSGGAAAAAAAGAGSGGAAGAAVGGGAGKQRKQGPAPKGFVEAINKGSGAAVRKAQAGARAAGAAARSLGNTKTAAARGAAAAGADTDFFLHDEHSIDDMDWQDGEALQAARHPHLGARHTSLRHTLALGLDIVVAQYELRHLGAKLQCRLVVLDSEPPEQQPGDDVDVDNYILVSGTFWRSEEQELQVAADQQAAHQQLLAEMRNEQAGQARLFLIGGAFNLAAHASVRRFMDDAAAHYKPLLFIPDQASGKQMIRDLLGEPARVVVMSVGNKLLVLAPTCTGELVAVCARELAATEHLTDDVVKTIMQHPKLGCPSKERDGSHQPSNLSESLLGPEPGAVVEEEENDNKDGILEQHQQPQQQEQQQEEEEQQQQQQEQEQEKLEVKESEEEGQVPPTQDPADQQAAAPQPTPQLLLQQQQLQLLEQQNSAAGAELSTCLGRPPPPQQQQPDVAAEHLAPGSQQQQQESARLPVEQLPTGMRTTSTAQQQQQQQDLGSSGLAMQTAANAAALTGNEAAAAGGGGGMQLAGNSRLSTREAVESSGLAQLIKKLGLDRVGSCAAQQKQQRQSGLQEQSLTLRSCMPQVSDLSDVQHLRLFLVGFPPEWLQESGSGLSGPLAAARKLVDGVYSSPRALEELLQDLNLQHLLLSHPNSPSTVLGSSQQQCAAPGSPPAEALGDMGAAGGAGGEVGGSVDLTQGPRDTCYRVLLVPEHFDSQQLQAVLGPVPLWQLLTSPVVIFKQGPGHGLLHQLQAMRRQQDHRQRQQQQPRQDGGQDQSGLRLPASLIRQQLYCDGLAVVVDDTTLTHCSTADVQELLQLLTRAQQQLRACQAEAGAGGVQAVGSGWQLLLSKQHLDSLSADKQQLLTAGLSQHIVVLLDECLAPGSLAAAVADDDPTPIIKTAATLAAQHTHDLRHVVVLTPDCVTSQPQSPALSGAHGGAGAVSGHTKPTGSKSSKGSQQGRTGGNSKGSSGQQVVQQVTPDTRLLAGNVYLTLSRGAGEPRLLMGTSSQLLQLLTGLTGSSSSSSNDAEGVADPASP